MLEIKTNQLKTRKKVLIDGVEYTVRRMGNIEQLDLSQSMRRLRRLTEIEDSGTKLTAKQQAEVFEISDKLSSMFVALFDDGGDQTKSRAMISTLNDEEINLMLTEIFKDGETTETATPEAIS